MTDELKAATVAPSPWDQATLSINGNKVERGTAPVLLRGQENVVTVEAPPAIARALNLGLPEDGGLSIAALPDFGNWVAPVDGKFTWKITPGTGKSGRIALVFFSREVLESWEHRSLVISSNLADEADVKIGGVAVPAGGNWFYRGKAQTVTLTPKSGSPLAGHPVTLTCAIKSGLDVANVVSAPAFGSESTTHSWAVTGNTKSGTFQLALSGKGMTTPITLAVSKLLSSNLADEADAKIGGVTVPAGGNWFYRGKSQTVTLTPKSGSPLAGLPVKLTCAIKSGLDVANVVSSPSFGSEPTTHSWLVGGNTKSGTFQMTLSGKGMTTPITLAVSKLLSNNLADEADVKIGGVAVPAGGNWFYRGKAQTVTLTPKPNSPLAGLPVKLTCAIKSGLDVTNVVSAPAFGSEPTTHSWAVTGNTKSGTFQLALSGKGMTTPITLAVSKLLSSNLADEADVKIADAAVPAEGNWFYRNHGRIVTLTPKPNSPLAGLPVTLTWSIKSGLASDSVVSIPAFGSEQTTYSWAVIGRIHSGTFQLALVGKGMSTPITLAVSKLVSGELRDEVEVKIGGQSVPASGNVFIRGQAQEVTLVPKPRSPIAGHNITLTCQPLQGLSEGDIQSAPPFGGIGGPNWSWQVTGYNRSGTFQISVVGAGGVIKPMKIAVSQLI